MSSKPAKKTLADLRAQFDKDILIPNRFRAALEALKATGDDYMLEVDFKQLFIPPINNNDFAKYRDQFKEFWAEMPMTHRKTRAPNAWFPTVELANEWRKPHAKNSR